MTDPKQILAFTVQVGQLLLNNGAEVYRTQDTMQRIAAAYGIRKFHVYVLTNGLFASVDGQGSEIRYVAASRVHLGRVAAVNELSRDIASGKVEMDRAVQRLAEIEEMPFLSPLKQMFASAVGAACFAFLFGGTLFDALAAFVAGFVMQSAFLRMGKSPTIGKIIKNVLAAAIVAVCSVAIHQLFVILGITSYFDKIIIGGIIPLVPGMALTTSIRDLANGDYLSGTIRLMDALLIAGSIAIGVGMVILLCNTIPWVKI